MKEESLLGVFDSGVGGFSVYKKIKTVSDANTIYYGDCVNAPYGNRDDAEIVRFIQDDILFLKEKGATHFVNACNSMSVVTTDNLLARCQVSPLYYTDMIRAFDLHAVFEGGERVLIIATQATIRSGAYQDVLVNKGVKVSEYVYKDLAYAIENNSSAEELRSIIENGILYAKEVGATHILYGCTHYPLVHELFAEAKEKLDWQGEFIDPSIYVAKEVARWGLKGERKFVPYTSKDTAVFIKHVIKLL